MAGSPLRLLRFPGVLVAVLGAAVVLGAAAASRELYLASIGTATVGEEVARAGSTTAGISALTEGALSADRVAYRTELFADLTEDVAGLEPTILSLVTETVANVYPEGGGETDRFVVLGTRTAFRGHLRVVEESGGEGWWLAASVAEDVGVRAGDRLVVEIGVNVGGGRVSPTGQATTVRVAGVYEDLTRRPPDDYWRPLAPHIGQTAPGGLGELPPPLMLADLETFLGVAGTFALDGELRWEAPAEGGLTLPAARRLAARQGAAEARFEDPTEPFGASFDSHGAGMPTVVERAERGVAALRGSVDAIAWAGVAVALAVFVAAGAYGVQHRRTEYAALSARGVGAAYLGARASAEALLPAAAGAAGGWVVGMLVVRLVGPADLLPPEAIRGSVRDAALAAGGGLVLLAAVAGAAVRGLAAGTAPGRGGGRVRRALGRFPWEAGLLLLALAALYEILTRGAAPSGGSRGAPPEVDLLVPLFPILFVAGAGGLALRGLRRLLPRLRTAGGRARAGLYLAARRLAAVPRSALLLVMVGALAVGILSYAGVFVASSEATARQKSLVFVGADAAVGVNGPVELPAAVAARATLVVRLPVATTSEGLPVAVLGVDPATFPRAAFFDPGFAGGSLEGLLGRLGPMEGGELPVLVAGAGFPRSTALDLLGRDVPVRVVATAEAFPGMPGSAPLVVASAAGLEEALRSPLRNFQPAFQVWVRGDPEPVVDALLARGVVPQGVLTAAQVREQPAFRSLGWIFGFMQVLGMLVGTVALTATLLYLQSRQRSREMSYALARRMGLARRSHRRSVALELAGMLGVALVVGAGAAAGAALLVHRELDFMPGLPPAAVVRAPWTLLAATVATLAAFTWIGAWAVQRRADRANIAEVMRLAG